MELTEIYKLIPLVMADVGAIEKASKNTQQNYKFRGIDDVMGAFQPVLAKHKVFFVPEVISATQTDREAKSGSNLIYTTLTVAYTFFAPDGSFVRAVVVGEAMDSADKSSNKAMSAALKYALLQVFCVPVDAADDADGHSPDVKPRITPNDARQQRAESQPTSQMTERDQLLAKAKELAEACGAEEVKRQLSAYNNAERISALTDAQLPKLISGLELFLKRRK